MRREAARSPGVGPPEVQQSAVTPTYACRMLPLAVLTTQEQRSAALQPALQPAFLPAWPKDSAPLASRPGRNQLRMPVTIPVRETVATVVSLDSQLGTVPMFSMTRRPVRSTKLEANLILLPTPRLADAGSTCTDAGAGNAYAADVRSVTSAPLLFASVPPQAAAARINAMSTGLLLRFTIRSSGKTPFGSPTSMACGRTL